MKISDKIKTIKISDIKAYNKNAKLHSNEQVDLLRRSFEEYGYYAPIGVDKNNVVVFGHGRLEALKIKGETEIEAVDLSYLSASEIKKLRILDNKIISNEYDDIALQEEIDLIAKECNKEVTEIAKELNCKSIEPEILNDISLPSGDNEFCQMTFVLSNRQAEIVKNTINAIKNEIVPEDNENQNGNALELICLKSM